MEEHEEWEPLWSARGSPATSSAGSLAVADELDEQQSPPAGGGSMMVFVAVPEEVSDGMSTLLWALHNLVRDGSKVVIAHVHSPAQRKPFLFSRGAPPDLAIASRPCSVMHHLLMERGNEKQLYSIKILHGDIYPNPTISSRSAKARG